MARTATINVRVSPEIKQKSENLFARFGITVSDAVNIFLHQALYEGGLPFELKQEIPNTELTAALEESEKIAKDPTAKTYTDVDKMMNEILTVAEDTPDYKA